MKRVLKKSKSSPGSRLLAWLEDNYRIYPTQHQKDRISSEVNRRIHAEVMKERRRCARLCEEAAKVAEGFDTDATGVAAHGIRSVRARIIKGAKP